MICRISLVLAALIATVSSRPLLRHQQRATLDLLPASTTCVTTAGFNTCTYIDVDGSSYMYTYPLKSKPELQFGDLIGLSSAQINAAPTGLKDVPSLGGLGSLGGATGLGGLIGGGVVSGLL